MAAEYRPPAAIRDGRVRQTAAITPVYVFAAIMAAAGVMVAPPIIAALTRPSPMRRPALVTALCLSTIAVAIAASALAPAYTYERPLRRHVRALQEPDSSTALWEVASIEPGLDLAAGRPPGGPCRQMPRPRAFRGAASATLRVPNSCGHRWDRLLPTSPASPSRRSRQRRRLGESCPQRGALAISFVLPVRPDAIALEFSRRCRGLANGRPRLSRRRRKGSRGARRSVPPGMPPGYATSASSSPIPAFPRHRLAATSRLAAAGTRGVDGTPRPWVLRANPEPAGPVAPPGRPSRLNPCLHYAKLRNGYVV